MSELGASGTPNALLMNVFGFGLLGTAIIVFSFGLHWGLSNGKGSRIGPALIAMAGIGLILTGFFSCEPGCANTCLQGTLHDLSAMIPVIAVVLALIALYPRIKSDEKWKEFGAFTLAVAVLAAIIGLVVLFTRIEGTMGLLQRLGMGLPLLWVEVMAFRLFRQQ